VDQTHPEVENPNPEMKADIEQKLRVCALCYILCCVHSMTVGLIVFKLLRRRGWAVEACIWFAMSLNGRRLTIVEVTRCVVFGWISSFGLTSAETRCLLVN